MWGSTDFYARLDQDKYKLPEDNPPIGIILCANKNEAIAKYSALADSKTLFASRYVLYSPTEKELAAEVDGVTLEHQLRESC